MEVREEERVVEVREEEGVEVRVQERVGIVYTRHAMTVIDEMQEQSSSQIRILSCAYLGSRTMTKSAPADPLRRPIRPPIPERPYTSAVSSPRKIHAELPGPSMGTSGT